MSPLLDELISIRDGIVAGGDAEAASVCNDRLLELISQSMPMNMESLRRLKGFTDAFGTYYADRFIAAVRKYAGVSTVDDSKRVPEILKGLSNKLTDLSKNNSMINLRSLGKSSVDLSGKGLNLNFFKGRTSIPICNKDKNKSESECFERINRLLREVKSTMRDIGQNDLYVAYPFAVGIMPGVKTECKTPLALFPVEVYRNGSTFSLGADKSRDIVFNSNFALAMLDYHERPKNVASTVVDDFDPETFMDVMEEFYSKCDIKLVRTDMSVCVPFDVDTVYSDSAFTVQSSMVLGKFSNDSSSIQRDYGDLMQDDNLPEIINRLILTRVDDFYYDPVRYGHAVNIKEADLRYINSLDGSQEEILNALKDNDALVVQGPPGTGKSQVITGLIAGAVSEGKSVLLVSEKKTALDVIKSRLGDLSKCALLVDDASDKNAFYGQLYEILDMSRPRKGINDLSKVTDDIESAVSELKELGDKIYCPMDGLGVEPCKLYELGRLFDYSVPGEYDRYNSIMSVTDECLFNMKFDRLVSTYKDMCDPHLVSSLIEGSRATESVPWVKDLKTNLSDLDISRMLSDIKETEAMYQAVEKAGIFKKRAAEKAYRASLGKLCEKYFTHDIETVPSVSDVADVLSAYRSYASTADKFRDMDFQTKAYFDAVFKLCQGDLSRLKEANDSLVSAILDTHINRFDADNRSLHHTMNSYNGILDRMQRGINDKMQLVKEDMLSELEDSVDGAVKGVKNDMYSIIESVNKWSIPKFMKRFGDKILGGIKIWMMTPDAVSDMLPMKKGLFDVLMFDEASQIYVERSLPSIYRAKKVVISGDHKQLRPSCLGASRIRYEDDPDDIGSKMESALEQESLLDLARINYNTYSLNYHYRARYQELIQFSNMAFYDGRLFVSPNVNPPELPPIRYIKVDGGIWKDKCNDAEAVEVVKNIRQILKDRKCGESIGVITFNSSQRDRIFDELDEECRKDPAFEEIISNEMSRKDNGEDRGLFIKNIESVQGDERDIVIFSIGYARGESGNVENRFGWLNDAGGENRLNVAITRAKKQIRIITSILPDELSTENTKNRGPKLLKEYLRYCKAVNDQCPERIDTVLNELCEKKDEKSENTAKLVEELAVMLEEHGYKVDRNVGVGAHNLDLAVRSADSDGYIAGLEMDTSVYGYSDQARDRDYHRTMYLRNRGWNVLRVWTPEYWINREHEQKRILDELSSFVKN